MAKKRSRKYVYGQLVQIVADMKIDTAKIAEDVAFMDLGADSLDMMELAMEAEIKFQLVIDDEQLGQILTFGQFVDYVHEHQGTALLPPEEEVSDEQA